MGTSFFLYTILSIRYCSQEPCYLNFKQSKHVNSVHEYFSREMSFTILVYNFHYVEIMNKKTKVIIK